jgi:hypothetical protein
VPLVPTLALNPVDLQKILLRHDILPSERRVTGFFLLSISLVYLPVPRTPHRGISSSFIGRFDDLGSVPEHSPTENCHSGWESKAIITDTDFPESPA